MTRANLARGGGGLPSRCWLVSEGDNSQPLIVASPLRFCAISPDARWLAVELAGPGEHEIYVQAIDGSSRVKIASGRWPQWSADGAELFFRRSGTLLAVPIDTTVPNETVPNDPSPEAASG